MKRKTMIDALVKYATDSDPDLDEDLYRENVAKCSTSGLQRRVDVFAKKKAKKKVSR